MYRFVCSIGEEKEKKVFGKEGGTSSKFKTVEDLFLYSALD